MAFRQRLTSVSFPVNSLTLASSGLVLLLLLSSTSTSVSERGQEKLHTALARGSVRLAEARNIPDQSIISPHALERGLLGLRPGSQGGQQQTPEPCAKSTLPGFTAMIALSEYAGLYFHFKVQGSTLNGALEARTVADGGASKGWFAIGFSKTGKMAGSDVVLGNYIPSTGKKLPLDPKPGGIGPKQPRPIAYLSATGTKTGNSSKGGNGTRSGGTKKGSGSGDGSTNSTKSGNSGNRTVGSKGKGKGPLVGAFNMKSLTMGTYEMANNFKIANTSVTVTKSGTVVRFTRSGPGGSVPVKYGGINTFIWSYSSNGATRVFGGHMRHRGSAVVNLACKV